jgi:hypothetical protein
VVTHFGDSVGESTTSSTLSMKGGDTAGESTTSNTLSMKGGNSRSNGSNLDKGNILKPTLDTLMMEGHEVFKGYHANLEEPFFSHCEVT